MSTQTPMASHAPANGGVTLPLCFIIFFSVLNGTMFNVAVPFIATEFTLLPSEVSWTVTGYIVVFALGATVYGKLADSRPIRSLITIGLVLFNAGSLLGLVSAWYPMLVAARVIQAAGASAIPALAMIAATRYARPGERGRMLGAFASTVAFGAGVGPVVGGFITGSLHWRYLFVLTALTLMAVPTLRRRLPREPARPARFDMAGAALLGLAVGLALYGITTRGTHAPALFASGLVAGAAFVWHIRRSGHPFITPALFSNRPFRGSITTAFLSMGSMFVVFFGTPLMLRMVSGMDAHAIGMTLFPGALCAAVMGTLGGRLVDRYGGWRMVVAGNTVMLIGHMALSTIAGGSALAVGAALVVSYTGFSFLQSSLPHTVSTHLPPEHTGVGMGMYNLFFFIAGGFTTALAGRALDAGTAAQAWNPLSTVPEAGAFSNVFLALALTVAVSLAVFVMSVPRRGTHA